MEDNVFIGKIWYILYTKYMFNVKEVIKYHLILIICSLSLKIILLFKYETLFNHKYDIIVMK